MTSEHLLHGTIVIAMSHETRSKIRSHKRSMPEFIIELNSIIFWNCSIWTNISKIFLKFNKTLMTKQEQDAKSYTWKLFLQPQHMSCEAFPVWNYSLAELLESPLIFDEGQCLVSSCSLLFRSHDQCNIF